MELQDQGHTSSNQVMVVIFGTTNVNDVVISKVNYIASFVLYNYFLDISRIIKHSLKHKKNTAVYT